MVDGRFEIAKKDFEPIISRIIQSTNNRCTTRVYKKDHLVLWEQGQYN